MSAPNRYQLILLHKATMHLEEENISPYLELKRLLTDKPGGFQREFRRIFESYFGLNAGGVTDAFKDRYFELLFGLEIQDRDDPHTPILMELYEIPRRKGDKALQCSFVSKLVAIHDESYPLFDRHVSDFFGIAVPSNGSIDFRVAGFIANLKHLRKTYQRWSEDSEFQKILLAVKQRFPYLKDCTAPRIADFLVWAVGRNKLGSTPAGGAK
jgi:hypothetical protein